jgi:hypothetical protein
MPVFDKEVVESVTSGAGVTEGVTGIGSVGDEVGDISTGKKGVGEMETTVGGYCSPAWGIGVACRLIAVGARVQAANKMGKKNIFQPLQPWLTA